MSGEVLVWDGEDMDLNEDTEDIASIIFEIQSAETSATHIITVRHESQQFHFISQEEMANLILDL